ncbi:MAG: divergent polysaccharide deacetylase family protein [Campylobacter sp.]|nr:divergent polysaccharide deacetylase family protein [Campylobacter sp.]
MALIYSMSGAKKEKEQISQQKDKAKEEVLVKNVEVKIKKEQKKLRETIKFTKDENLSKIFLDPKSKDETYALNQNKQEAKTIAKSQGEKAQDDKTAPQSDKKAQSKDKERLKDENLSKIFTSQKNKASELDVGFNGEIIAEQRHIPKYNDKLNSQILKEDENSSHIKFDKNKSTKSDDKILDDIKNKIINQNKKPQSKEKSDEISKDTGKKAKHSGNAKLAIIIDDVATSTHVKMLKQTGLLLTPSIFPPDKNHPKTPELAKNFAFYMVHLPMQAQKNGGAEYATMMVGDSFESISKKLANIRKNFPNARFINNHTGSKFTADFASMDKAFRGFERENFIFLDSKTTPKSVVKQVAKKHKKVYIYRDIFLDDVDDERLIRKELKKAVSIAKRHGIAIAIGHPRKKTMAVLKNSKSLLRDVELIYIKDAYKFYR